MRDLKEYFDSMNDSFIKFELSQQIADLLCKGRISLMDQSMVHNHLINLGVQYQYNEKVHEHEYTY